MKKLLFVFGLFILMSCEDGKEGAEGVDGLMILVISEDEPNGTNCANGGTKLSFGGDINGNNVLSVDEITNTFYVCNGDDGDDGDDGLDGNENVNVQIVSWNANNTEFVQTNEPNNGDGYVKATFTNTGVTSDVVANGIILVEIGSATSGTWWSMPYFIIGGGENDYIYDSWYGYTAGELMIGWNCSFGRTYNEWLEVSFLYEADYKISIIEGNN
jgi:hypothetical protein